MIWRYYKGWGAIPEEFTKHKQAEHIGVSILVCARNEAENIEACLQSLCQQEYSKELVEIILIDDFSEDETVSLATSFSEVKILELKNILDNSYIEKANKKRAITYGMTQAKHDIIITADADCVFGRHWLQAMVQFYEKRRLKMITAPLLFDVKESLAAKFLQLDLISLMGITAAGLENKQPSMVNGANLLFEKNAFYAVNAYDGNEAIPSGDDVFLMQKIWKKYPNEIGFLKNKDAIAQTQAPKDFNTFVQQRIRWTSKSKGYAEPKIKATLILNVLFYLSLILGLFVLPFFNLSILNISLTLFCIKLILDYFFFKKTTAFFNQSYLMRSFFVIELLHLLYISVLGFLSLLPNYTWKGRKV